MAALFERRAGVLEVGDMGRGDDDAVHRHGVEHLAEILESLGNGESTLHLSEFRLAEPIDRDDLAIGQRFEDGDVVDDGPPAGADHANSRPPVHPRSFISMNMKATRRMAALFRASGMTVRLASRGAPADDGSGARE